MDYQTKAFMGGNAFQFNNIPFTNSIPLEEIYIQPGDFGSYTLKYTPTDEIVFQGPIHWLSFSYNYPVSLTPSTFALSNNSAPITLSNAVFFIPTQYYLDSENINTNFDYQEIWDTVKNLEITNQYVNQGAKVGFLFYTPGLGFFQPETAAWFVILYK
ncbi:hypothetical protein [Flavobacterium sp. J27]|uniref:hypothetical protein n=1 Tax=Flavobacterium sp. J27 TaxID=2060419 RepID=UPI00102F8EA1|nr:hypothetical protein [Flavobacterium sp. J27]